MARAQDISFDQRVGRIVKTRRKMARGAVAHVGPDGLVSVRPRKRGLRFPWRGVFLILLVLVMAKVGLYTALGAEAYVGKLAMYEDGGAIEQAILWVMQPDRVTVELSGRIGQLF